MTDHEERQHRARAVKAFLLGFGLATFVLAGAWLRGRSIDEWLGNSDTPSYIAVARLMATGEEPFDRWHERVFLGWPAILVPVVPWKAPVLALLLASTLQALAAALFYRLTLDLGLTAVFAAANPAWVASGALGFSEPALVVLCLLAILLFRANSFLVSGAALGFAAWIRPVAVFLWLGLAWVLLRQRMLRELVGFSALSGAIAFSMLLANWALYEDPLRQFHSYLALPNVSTDALQALQNPYSTGTFGPPFYNFVRAALFAEVPAAKLAYATTHAIVVLALCVVAVRSFRDSDLQATVSVWFLGNSLFIFCTGPYWALHSFDRYAIWALPAGVILARRYIPRSWLLITAYALVNLALALIGPANLLD